MACEITGPQFYNGRSGWVPAYIPNAVKDIVLSTSPSVVTVQEIKDDLKIDFADEDAYITDLIALCQSHVEQFCGISCATRTLSAVVCNNEGSIEIPYGPVQSITSATDENGNDITDQIVTNGISFKWMKSPCLTYINITYVAGYTILPLDLNKAIRMEVGFRYRFRNQEEPVRGVLNPGLCDDVVIYANPFKRMRFI